MQVESLATLTWQICIKDKINSDGTQTCCFRRHSELKEEMQLVSSWLESP